MVGTGALAALSFLIVTPYDPEFLANSQHGCLNYYGLFGGNAVFQTDSLVACLGLYSSHLSYAQLVPFTEDESRRIVWVERVVAEDNLLAADSAAEAVFFDKLVDAPSLYHAKEGLHQVVLDDIHSETECITLYRSNSSAMLSIPRSILDTFDMYLPSLWNMRPLPLEPVQYLPVPPGDVKRVSDILNALKYNPAIGGLVNNISLPQLKNDVRWLSGEDSNIISRHSFSADARVAAAWLQDRFEETGAKCELMSFLEGFTPNVICRYPAVTDTNSTIIIAAHYDSRGSFGSTRAPGGDDDGSGVAGLLAIARTIDRRNIRFHSNVELCAFGGEEQGLRGSRAYASKLRESNANITFMLQADMTGYHVPGEPPQLGMPEFIGTSEVTQLLANISAIYSPELTVGFSPACCSDHQPFHEQGFAASHLFERAGPIADPMYHNSGDVTERIGYDFEQIRSIAKVQFATILHAAGFEIQARRS